MDRFQDVLAAQRLSQNDFGRIALASVLPSVYNPKTYDATVTKDLIDEETLTEIFRAGGSAAGMEYSIKAYLGDYCSFADLPDCTELFEKVLVDLKDYAMPLPEGADGVNEILYNLALIIGYVHKVLGDILDNENDNLDSKQLMHFSIIYRAVENLGCLAMVSTQEA